jgi:hypothetical protein
MPSYADATDQARLVNGSERRGSRHGPLRYPRDAEEGSIQRTTMRAFHHGNADQRRQNAVPF